MHAHAACAQHPDERKKVAGRFSPFFASSSSPIFFNLVVVALFFAVWLALLCFAHTISTCATKATRIAPAVCFLAPPLFCSFTTALHSSPQLRSSAPCASPDTTTYHHQGLFALLCFCFFFCFFCFFCLRHKTRRSREVWCEPQIHPLCLLICYCCFGL